MRIGIDFDDVVANTGIAIIEMHNKKHGTHYKKDDFYSYLFEEIWGGERDENRKEIDEFLTTNRSKKVSPMVGSLKAIQALKAAGHELYIITARRNKHITQTELWIEKHFPDVFTGVHYASPSRLKEEPRKKSEICEALGIEVLIDDSPENAFDCAAVGVKIFLFDQPWNRRHEFPKNVERVFSWDEVLHKLR
ncbi:MAG: hypothetical protein Q7R85_01040 [bacterium]|nr:hypothetical protein [bacterium]